MSGTADIGTVLKVFYAYAHQDKKLRDILEKHLSGLQRQGIITNWHYGEIEAGTEWEVVLKRHLDLSDIILLLISPDFIASDYCYCVEMTHAVEKHARGEARVIPILLRPTDTVGLPFALLQFLPTDRKAITRQRDKDDAFARIVAALRNVIKEISTQLTSEPAPAGGSAAPPTWWKVPSPRNPLFTGRNSMLEQLHAAALARDTGIFIQALNGLGGIGKTQIALEYVYRYVHTYQAIFWVAADMQGDLLADFINIAQILHLPEKDEPKQSRIVTAIKQWLQQHKRWLLIFDNVEDVVAMDALLPTRGDGHILITTRALATGKIAASWEVASMDMQEGTQFLLQRAKLLSQAMSPAEMEQQRKAAEEITQLFAGHALALDQAGAYVEETGLLLSDYLDIYQRRQGALLQRRGDTSADHPESVMTTFSLAFERVERMRPDAAELLRFCAFLHPDALPEELLLAGALSFAPDTQGLARDPYELNDSLAVLRKYSLIKRNPMTKTVSIHRLVQEVLKSSMQEEQQRYWAEAVVRTLGREFPDGEPDSWAACLRYLPHARVAMDLLDGWQMHFIEAVHLLNHVGYYLYKRAEYTDAQACYEHALRLLAEGDEQVITAQILSNLGVLHLMQSHYLEAEDSLRKALRIREELLEPTHPDLAQSFNDLAGVYHNQGNLAKAEPLYQQALALQEQMLGAEDAVTARTLNNLALLKYNQHKYAESEAFNRRALKAREKHLGTEHVDTGQSLLNLAYVYRMQQRYTEAEPLFQRALTIWEQAYGPEHPQTAIAFNGIGLLYFDQQRYAEAEPFFQRALTIWEKIYSSEHPRMVGTLNSLATISMSQGRYEEAEQLFRRAFQIQEKTAWLERTDLVPGLRELARAYEDQKKYEQARSLFQLIVTIQQHVQREERPAAVPEDDQ